MSVEAIGTEVIVPKFSTDLVRTTLEEVRAMPSADAFRRGELAIMGEHNLPLVLLHGQILGEAARQQGPAGEADRRSMGYLLGHRVLCGAGDSEALPMRAPLQIEAYVRRLKLIDGALELDFKRDYADHEPVMHMMEQDLTNSGSKYGAMLILALYGGWANPNREPIELPPPPPLQAKAAPKHSHSFAGDRYRTSRR